MISNHCSFRAHLPHEVHGSVQPQEEIGVDGGTSKNAEHNRNYRMHRYVALPRDNPLCATSLQTQTSAGLFAIRQLHFVFGYPVVLAKALSESVELYASRRDCMEGFLSEARPDTIRRVHIQGTHPRSTSSPQREA